MSAWGVGTFENDMALDTRDCFGDALEQHGSVAAATQAVLRQLANYLDDAEDAAALALALAALQLQHDALQPQIRDWALTVARGPVVWYGWDATDAQTQAERRQYLEGMVCQLTHAHTQP